ncbi:MAG TPA: hypothetical protein VMZ74_08045 [Ramlibacter sp.]|nr:hypothetical protein [Ramlibacter sp.]
MNATGSTAQSSAPQHAARVPAQLPDVHDEDEVAIGWECANPALQIDVWGRELPADAHA